MAAVKPIGFVGLGNMGAPMARCLARAGHIVLLYDVRREALAPFAAEGAPFAPAEHLAQVGASCEIVITMLPDSRAVRETVLGRGGEGVAASLVAGGAIVDMSSSFPLETRKLGDELASRGIGLADAPVSGGVPKAAAGTLTIMAGGDTALLDRVAPILRCMGTVLHTGSLGSGHAMKALNNYVSAAGLIATCEALVIGERFGLDPHVMTRVLNASTGRNHSTENKVERFLLSGAFNSGFSLALMNKDVGMALAMAEELGVTANELPTAVSILSRAHAALGRDADHTEIYRYAMGLTGPRPPARRYRRGRRCGPCWWSRPSPKARRR